MQVFTAADISKRFFKKRLTNNLKYAILIYGESSPIPHEDLGVAQLVARYLGVVEAVGSSPVTQIA